MVRHITWRCCISFYSYIKPQLLMAICAKAMSCISFYSYIKPQLISQASYQGCCCISFYSYIKPQLILSPSEGKPVVYRSIPTSNRNCLSTLENQLVLYIVLFLHQTATKGSNGLGVGPLYIVLFLHQTATVMKEEIKGVCCISFYSYIKPQLLCCRLASDFVVYRSIPTSNRNQALWLF